MADATKSFDIGGLRFEVSFRGPGATLQVYGPEQGDPVQDVSGSGGAEPGGSAPKGSAELLRFDDFADTPHYHAPPSLNRIIFDRSLGEPLSWYIDQIANHLPELLESSGFGDLVPRVDFDEITRQAETLRQAMVDVVPDDFERLPGYGLRRVGAAS